MQELIDFLLLRDYNVRIVVIGSVLLGIGSAAIGCFAFLRRRSLTGDAVSHAALPGVAIAFLLFGSKSTIGLLIGAAITGWIAMLAMDAVVRNSRITEDTSLGMVLSVFFGLGILLVTHIQASGNPDQSGLDKFLFGQAASMLQSDVVVFGAVSALLILSILLFFKELQLLSFDPGFGTAIGLPTRLLEIGMTTLLVLAVVVGLQSVGVVLMAAMLITPAAAARYWTERLPVMILLAAIFGGISGIVGAWISYTAPRMPTGPWIVTAATMIFVVSLLFAPQRGAVARLRRHRGNRRRTNAENVLKALYHLAEEDGAVERPRTIADITARRRLPEPMLRRILRQLRREGYIEPVDGGAAWRLSAEGMRQGARVTRLHRLWELYLTEYVQIAPDHVHDDAESIEHVLTPELEAELERLLERPESDPHQRAIPYRS